MQYGCILLLVLGLTSCGGRAEPEPKRGKTKKAKRAPKKPAEVILYSTDNNEKLGLQGSGFAPDDPKYMTIALRARPLGETLFRLPDNGEGIHAKIMGRARDRIGQSWIKVQLDDGRAGWIAEAWSRNLNK